MGHASARKEIAADLRRKIGDNAAAAVGELRESLDQTNKNARALAQGLAQVEKRIDAAAAAPAKLREDIAAHAEQLEAIGLRLRDMASRAYARDAVAELKALIFDGPVCFYAGINGRLEAIENGRARLPHGLALLHARRAEQLARLPRWAWLRRRVAQAQLNVIADLIEILDAENRAAQRVIE